MSEIKRVAIYTTKNSVDIRFAADGEFVRYTDHLATLKQACLEAKASAVREFVESAIQAESKDLCGGYMWDLSDLEDYSKEYIEQLEKAEGLNKYYDNNQLKEQSND